MISPASPDWNFEVFFDRECPLCRKEIAMLRWLDRRQRVRFTDITEPSFRPESVGRTYDELMAEIHGRRPDGTMVTGVEVFRQLYSAIGLGWFVPVTRLPGISHLLDWGYRVFARNRLNLTGRCRTSGACATSSRAKETT